MIEIFPSIVRGYGWVPIYLPIPCEGGGGGGCHYIFPSLLREGAVCNPCPYGIAPLLYSPLIRGETFIPSLVREGVGVGAIIFFPPL